MTQTRRTFLLSLPLIAVVPGIALAEARKKPKPERIRFKKGKISSTIKGVIKHPREMIYIIAVKEGQSLKVVVTSPANDVVFTVDTPSGNPLMGENEVSNDWTGPVTEAGDYRIKLATVESNTAKYRMLVMVY